MRDEVERAYAELVTERGAPRGNVLFRRIFVGPALPTSRLVKDAGFVHFESRERPVDVPAAARWVTARSANLDGGPGLANPVAILDQPHPHLIEDVHALARCWPAFCDAARIVAELHELLAAWGTSTLQQIIWLSPRLATDGLVGTLSVDVLGDLREVVRDLASDYTRYGARAFHEMWEGLANRGEIWPTSSDDTYAPGIAVARAWVGRRVADTPSPFAQLAELEASGFGVAALGGDQAVLVLPQNANV
jgi:hypothetical protein